jgi:hypothetical protein
VTERLTVAEFLELFGLKHDCTQSLALADSQETLALSTFLVGRSRYLGQ